MKKILIPFALLLFVACNNSKKDKPAGDNPQQTTGINPTVNNDVPPPPSDRGTVITVDGKELKLSGSLLVGKDKKKLQPGADYMAMLTASGGNAADHNSLTLNFLLDTKAGSYPVVGMSYQRGPSGNGELYGGIMGGEEKLTDYKVNITECKDLGSNNMGGHKWSISGTFENMTIPAMGIMLMDKTKNHPKEIKIEKGNFFNLTFDDNMEEMMEKAMEMMKKKN